MTYSMTFLTWLWFSFLPHILLYLTCHKYCDVCMLWMFAFCRLARNKLSPFYSKWCTSRCPLLYHKLANIPYLLLRTCASMLSYVALTPVGVCCIHVQHVFALTCAHVSHIQHVSGLEPTWRWLDLGRIVFSLQGLYDLGSRAFMKLSLI